MNNLKNRHLLSLTRHSQAEILSLIELAAKLKYDKKNGREQAKLQGKNIALIFEKTSTRTRCSFEVAAYDQGARVTYIDPTSSQMGHKESIKDTARVLGRLYDAIEYRGYSQEIVETLAKYSGVPVFNGLTDEYHPTQALADILTMQEHSNSKLKDIKYVYIGDARNNVANSLLLVGAQLGMDVRICAPIELQPEHQIKQQAFSFVEKTAAKITITDKIEHAVQDVDFVYTDIWVSMGEPVEAWQDRIKILMPYQVNLQLMEKTNNLNVKFMHCLPAFHNTETTIGKKIAKQYPELENGIEVTEQVFESKYNISFDQAENRMHTIKAVLQSSLA